MQPLPPKDHAHPKVRIERACAVFGHRAVALWCADLLAERPVGAGSPSIEWLGDGDWPTYWYRVWGARGLLYVWDGEVQPDVVSALRDPQWRVREMAAKVVRAQRLTEAADAVAAVADDRVERVRSAALRALAVVGEPAHLAAITRAKRDDAVEVRRAAERAIHRLDQRLTRRSRSSLET